MAVEDFDELYRLLRGTPWAMPILDAKGLCDEGQPQAALTAVEKVQEAYLQARQATLKQSVDHLAEQPKSALSKDDRRLKKRVDKAREGIELFEAIIDQLKKLASRSRTLAALESRPDPQRASAAAVASQTASVAAAAATIPSPALASAPVAVLSPPAIEPPLAAGMRLAMPIAQALAMAPDRAAWVEVLQQHFEIAPITDEDSLEVGTLLAISHPDQNEVAVLAEWSSESQSWRWASAIDGGWLPPLSASDLQQQASEGRILQLALREAASGAASSPPPTGDDLSPEEAEARDRVLDMGAFTQLADSAQRSGLVPSLSTILQVRDCEFRLGRYTLALQLMESQVSAFTAAEMSRQQRLAREDADIASGKHKLSPREMMAKRAKDRQDSEAIERARTRFSRVLEGLRALAR